MTAPDEWWAPQVTEHVRAVLDQVDDPEDALTAAGPHANWPFYLRGLLVSDPMGVCWYSFPFGCVSIADLLLGALHAAQEEPLEARALVESYGDRYLEPELLDRLVGETGCWADGALDVITDDRCGVFAAAGEPYSVIPLYAAYVAGTTGNPFLDDDGDEAGYIFVPWEIERLALVRDLHAEALASVARMQALTEALDTQDGQERFLAVLASAFPPHSST